MKVVITGGHGFLGWHTAVRLRALHGVVARRLGRPDIANPDLLNAAVADADVVLHLAGVNRADSEHAVREGNKSVAEAVANAIVARRRPVRVVYANSIQACGHSAYGEAKAQSADVLRRAVATVGGSLADVLLPNLFGEHGRPAYNSFVATFCDLVARGQTPVVTEDREVPLLHAQAAAQSLLDSMTGSEDEQLSPAGDRFDVSAVLDLIVGFHGLYSRGDIPALNQPFLLDLFNTYRSYMFPGHFPVYPQRHTDGRGELFETVRSHGGPGQVFVSTTRAKATRGDHYHLHKVERFFVVKGEAEIALRRLLDDRVVRFRVSGSEPGFVDMPTLWVHNITNVGEGELVTTFWGNQLLDFAHPDQYPERVELAVGA